VLLKSDDQQYRKSLEHYRALGVPFEDWDTGTLLSRVPYYDAHRFWPPSRPADDSFWETPTTELDGAVFTPDSGYASDPVLATHNLQRAAEAAGARFLLRRTVVEVRSGSRVQGSPSTAASASTPRWWSTWPARTPLWSTRWPASSPA